MHSRIVQRLNILKRCYPNMQLCSPISTKEPTSATATAPQVQPSFEEGRDSREEQRIRWQKRETKYSIEPPPVHTCMTKEETQEYLKRNLIKFNPDLAKLDTLPKHEWRGVFQLLGQSKGIGSEELLILQTMLGGQGTSRKELIKDMMLESTIKDQEFLQSRVDYLGPDLAAAHFSTHRGARVRFHGKEKWFTKDDDEESGLPRKNTPGWHLKEIDASKMTLYYNGLQNFRDCEGLETLKLYGNKNVDNFFIDRICHQHSNSLVSLDISFCPLLTIGGITALVRLRKLRRLVVSGLNIPHLPLACLCLEEELPGLEVVGVSYEGVSMPEGEVKGVEDALTPDRIKLRK